MTNSQRIVIEQRRRNWRIALGAVIAITIPFYCAGIFLWGTAPQKATPTPIGTQQPQIVTATPLPPTATPLGGFIPSVTPLAITPLFPTQDTGFPTQTLPTLVIQPTVTRFLSPTPPPPTQAPPPTNPPQPTNPPAPTQPAITNTPLPFD